MRHYWDFYPKMNPKLPIFLPYKAVERRCDREQHKLNRDCVVVQCKAHSIYFLVLESFRTTPTRTCLKMMDAMFQTQALMMYGNLVFEKFFFFELWIFHFWWKFFDRFSPFFFDRNFLREYDIFNFSWRFWLQPSLVFIYSTGVQLWRYSVGVKKAELTNSPTFFFLSVFTRIWRKRLFFFCLLSL